MKNFESFTWQWRLLSAWCMMLELHLSLGFIQRNWHRSPHDLHSSDRILWFPALVLSQESRDVVGQNANRQRKSLRMLLLLLLPATWIIHL